jgi:hypothetical protein
MLFRDSKKRDKATANNRRDSVSNKRDRTPLVLSTAVTLTVMGVYLMTLSPGITWAHNGADAGDLITAAYVAGVPHPTGYPLFCMLGWLWTHILPIGHVDWRMNTFTAFWGAMAAGILVRTVWRSFDLLPANLASGVTRGAKMIASVSSGLLMGFSLYTWQQSVITEVYSLAIFFVSLVTWILTELLAGADEAGDLSIKINAVAWDKKRARLVSLLGLSWGLALTNHLTSMFLFPSIMMVLFFGGIRLKLADFLKGAGLFILALLIYLYLPIRSAMNPPLNYGDPKTLDGFIWLVTGRQFKTLMFSLLPYISLHQIMRYNSLPLQIGALGAAAALIGVIELTQAKTRPVVVFAIHTFLLVAMSLFILASYSIFDPEGYILPMIMAASIWAAWSIVTFGKAPGSISKAAKAIGIVLLILAPIILMTNNWKLCDTSGNREAIKFGNQSFQTFEPDAVVLELGYERAFVMWYFREVEYAKTRPDVAVIYLEHMGFPWGIDLARRKYPNVEFPDKPFSGVNPVAEAAAYIIRHNIDTYPIYIGTTVDMLVDEGYRFQAVGYGYRVFPPGQ